MSATRFSTQLHRLEVHAGPLEKSTPELRWLVDAREGPVDSVWLWGYLRVAGDVGFGQAQAIGLIDDEDRRWSFVSRSEENRAAFVEWASRYVTESIWDTLRRSLQVQASSMDFQFPLDLQAPTIEIDFPELTGADETVEP